jgi:hypothetical protein
METSIESQIQISLKGSIETGAEGYKKLINLYQECSRYRNCIVNLNLSNLRWMDANLCALLQALLYHLHQNNQLTFSIDVELVKSHFDILFRNGFLSCLLELPDGAGTTVEMKTFKPDEVEGFYDYLSNELFGQEQLKNACKESNAIIDQLFEVFANIQLHADTTDPVFACGQYFPKKHQLKFTLLDLGRGYLPVIQKFTSLPSYQKQPVRTAEEAIRWALQGNSTKLDAPGGLGLSNLAEYCKKTAGAFHIATGTAYYDSKNPYAVTEVPFFPGSSVQLIFNC